MSAICCGIQIDVPHAVYGHCDYDFPKELADWLRNATGRTARYSYGSSWGNGFTNGITNLVSHYSVSDVSREDGLAFQMMFPKCKVHIFEL